MMESLLKRHKIIEILAPSVCGAFLFLVSLSFYFKTFDQLDKSLVSLFLLSSVLLLLNIIYLKNRKYDNFLLAVYSLFLTITYIYSGARKISIIIAIIAAIIICLKYVLKDNTYKTVILMNIIASLTIFINGDNYLLLNRIILIISASLFLIPKLLKYSRLEHYSKFVLFAVTIPIVSIFITENIGYVNYIYGVATISSVIGVGYFESAFLFKKDV